MLSFTKIILGCALLCLACFPSESVIAAGWSKPPKVIEQNSPPFYSTTSYLASDSKGNSVAVWFNTSNADPSIDTFQGAILASGDVNKKGLPNWVLTSAISTEVKQPIDLFSHVLGISDSGNALVAWTDLNNNINVSRLPSGSKLWSNPHRISSSLIGETVANPVVAVASNGNAVVTWTSAPLPYQYHVLANVFDAKTNKWLGQQELLDGMVELDSGTNQVAIDSRGNAAVLIATPDANIQVIRYHASNRIWTTIQPIDVPMNLTANVAMDAAGNTMVVWQQEDDTVYAARLPFDKNEFQSPVRLSEHGKFDFYNAVQIQFDPNGNAIAVWPELTGGLGSARYFASSGKWRVLPTINLDNQIPYFPVLSIDPRGNAVASWTLPIGLITNGIIQAAALGISDKMWGKVSQVSSSTDINILSQVSLTAQGDAVAIWSKEVGESSVTINSAIYLDLFPLPPPVPSPPRNFNGEVVRNAFAVQTDRIHRLTWTASVDRNVVSYKLYRNSKLLKTFANQGASFSYSDHNRIKGVIDTYTLESVSGANVPSAQLTLQLE